MYREQLAPAFLYGSLLGLGLCSILFQPGLAQPRVRPGQQPPALQNNRPGSNARPSATGTARPTPTAPTTGSRPPGRPEGRPESRPEGRPPHGPPPRHCMEEALDSLGLTAAQRAEIDELLESARERIDAIHEETRTGINGQLNTAQQAALRAALEECRPPGPPPPCEDCEETGQEIARR